MGTLTDDRPRVVRLPINLAPAVAEQLKALAARRGLSITETVRRAIGLLKLVEEGRTAGGTVVLRRPGQRDRELLILNEGTGQ